MAQAGQFREPPARAVTFKIRDLTQRHKDTARQAATKELEPKQTEKTEPGRFCQKCAALGNSTAEAQRGQMTENEISKVIIDAAIEAPRVRGGPGLPEEVGEEAASTAGFA